MAATVAGIHLGPDTHANRPAATAPPVGAFYYCSDHDKLYITDGTVWSDYFAASAGSVATDAIWDAKGDLAGGTGANTAAKLTVGSNDQVLTADSAQATGMKWAAAGSGLSTGTSFPGSPTTGDRYRRSDLDYRVFFYDGTRWLSEQLYEMQFPYIGNQTADASGAGTTIHSALRVRQGHSDGLTMWLIDWMVETLVITTSDGSNYWTIKLQERSDGSSSNTDISGASFDTSGDTAGLWTGHEDAIGGALASDARIVYPAWVKTGSPGGLYVSAALYYRLIAT